MYPVGTGPKIQLHDINFLSIAFGGRKDIVEIRKKN